jgi:hypothetical protein
MSDSKRTPSRPGIALGVLQNLGQRLVSEERPPYEMDDHDEVVHLDDPTGDIPLHNRRDHEKNQ